MTINCVSFVFRYDYIDLKGNSRLNRGKDSKSCHNHSKPRLSKSENDLSPYRVKSKPPFTFMDSTTETANNQTKPLRPSLLKLNLKGVSRFLSKNGANDQSNKSKGRGQKNIGGNPPPSSYSRHHLLQTPEVDEEEEEETMFGHVMNAVQKPCNSIQSPHVNKPLNNFSKFNHTLPKPRQDINDKDILSRNGPSLELDIHMKGE